MSDIVELIDAETTPRTAALADRIYCESTAYEVADPRFGGGHNWSPEEAYGAALDLARQLERELIQLPVWTTEKPTRPGWYWLRSPRSEPHLVPVFESNGGAYVRSDDEAIALERFDANCQWQGPITPNEAAE